MTILDLIKEIERLDGSDFYVSLSVHSRLGADVRRSMTVLCYLGGDMSKETTRMLTVDATDTGASTAIHWLRLLHGGENER